jgi:hypothetical protein
MWTGSMAGMYGDVVEGDVDENGELGDPDVSMVLIDCNSCLVSANVVKGHHLHAYVDGVHLEPNAALRGGHLSPCLHGLR